MSAAEAFPVVLEWEKFADTCATAEAARDHTKKAAKAERDRIVRFSKESTQWGALHRVESAANARYEHQLKEAKSSASARARQLKKP